MMRRTIGPVLVVALVGLAGAARAAEVPTGRTTSARLSSRARGLDADIPRGGSYERALQAVRQRHYLQATDLFIASAGELHRAALDGKISFPRSRTLALKARLHGEAANELARVEGDGRRMTRGGRLTSAMMLHRLYLAASAYGDRHDDELFRRAAEAYLAAFGESQIEPVARVCYAALLAAGGQRRPAAVEFARAGVGEQDTEMLRYLVEYYAAMGDRDRAFRGIVALRDADPAWPNVRAALRAGNELDNLRDDPRFPLLVGADE